MGILERVGFAERDQKMTKTGFQGVLSMKCRIPRAEAPKSHISKVPNSPLKTGSDR